MAAEFAAFAAAYQEALGAWLAADAGIVAAFAANPVRVLSAVDDRTVLPVIQTGEDDFRDGGVQDAPARIVTSRVHVWTREPGMLLVKRIGGAVLGAMTATNAAGVNIGLTVPGFELSHGRNLLERYLRDPADNVRHGVLDFEMRFVPAA